ADPAPRVGHGRRRHHRGRGPRHRDLGGRPGAAVPAVRAGRVGRALRRLRPGVVDRQGAGRGDARPRLGAQRRGPRVRVRGRVAAPAPRCSSAEVVSTSVDRDYLRRILNARVYDVAQETPLERAPALSARLGAALLLKREDLQPVFSFKLRGAYNKMVNLSPAALRRGVIAASAGNHAQGVALSAGKLGTRAVIVMPVTTPEVKVRAVRALGAEVHLHGDSYSDAYAYAVTWGRRRKLTFVHPFDDPDVIAGQGTVGMEILRQHHAQEHGPLHAIFVAVGGGGLAAGVATYVKAVRPDVKVIGVQTVDSDAMARSLAAGKRVPLSEVGLFSDGTAVRRIGSETFRLCRRHLDEMVTVDNDALCAAIKDVFQETRSILEPAGALGVAGAKVYAERRRLRGQSLVAVTTGANMNFDRLRFV